MKTHAIKKATKFDASASAKGITDDVLSSFEEDKDIDDDNEKGYAFEEENAEEVDDQERNGRA